MTNVNKDVLAALKLTEFVVFDVETTGLDFKKDSVIQFSAIKYKDGEVSDEIDYFCNPGKEISPFISELTRITDEMVANEPSFDDRIEDILNFIKDLPLVAHNAQFDMRFLKKATGDILLNPVIDTLELSRIFLYYLPDRKLETLSAHFELETEGAHRADVDTRNTGQLFLNLLDIMLHYDLPIYNDIIYITDPLSGQPNYHLYRDVADYYRKIGRTEKEKLKALHTVKDNKSGKFERNDELGDEDAVIRKISRQDIDNIFGMKGTLSQQLPNFEWRIGQMQLAGDVVEAFNEGEVLVGEAGTGVGKSLAYLIPAVKWMKKNRQNGMSIVVSSHTKNLQEQLFYKDVPFIHDHVESDLNVVLLKGRQNYICLTKFDWLMKNIDSAVSAFDRAALLPLIVWLRETLTGDIEENSGFQLGFFPQVWNRLCSEPGYCTTKKCASHNGCYLGKIRRLAHLADVVIVNHSLLLSDAVSNQSILPYHPILIVDEAHNLVKTAYQFMGFAINDWGITKVSNKLYTPGMIHSGVLVDLSRKIGKEIDWSADSLDILRKRISKAEKNVEDLHAASSAFFKGFLNYVNNNTRPKDQRYIFKSRYKPETSPFKDLEISDKLIESCHALRQTVNLLRKELDALAPKEAAVVYDIASDLDNAFKELDVLIKNLQTALFPEKEDLIYWYEVPTDANNHHISIKVAPLHVNQVLHEKVFANKHSVIATSATLTISDRFKYFLNRSGLNMIEEERRKEVQYESPFNYEEQCNVWCITQFQQPGNPKFDEQVANLLGDLSLQYKLGTLVLTTSYASIRNIKGTLEPKLRSGNIPLITQAGSASRTALLKRFTNSTQSMLIGTESFWEGVDIPGEPLEMLVMTKLPFGVPTEPVVEAITEDIKSNGGNAFMEYQIPEAILKFKQGLGRLIRSKRDRGVALILDNRLSFKRYGKYFIQSFPAPIYFVKSEEELFRNMDHWVKKNK